MFDPTGAWLLVGDVGNDRLTVYAFDHKTGTIINHIEALVTPLGGARHLTMSDDSKFLYVLDAVCFVYTCRRLIDRSDCLSL